VSVQLAYTDWSLTYDTDTNRTRDLDAVVTRQMLAGMQSHSILELGCGTGKNTVWLAELGERVLAMDFSEGMLGKAKAKITQPNVTFAFADLNQPWPTTDHTFDLVVGNLVLEHIANLDFIFAEAARSLNAGGHLFISELHPFRQYQGTQANFQRNQETTTIQAFVHHFSDYVQAAQASGFKLERVREWWHADDENKPPRLVSFLFKL
jgi:2-polyprenyl-3-methyl-5-hydroxy-6-metoxy-1,4-benzoquinol methylase